MKNQKYMFLVGEFGFKHERVWETFGLICYEQIDRWRNTRVLYHVRLSNNFFKLFIWLKFSTASSIGSELKSFMGRKLSHFDDEYESIPLVIYSKYPLIMVLCGLKLQIISQFCYLKFISLRNILRHNQYKTI